MAKICTSLEIPPTSFTDSVTTMAMVNGQPSAIAFTPSGSLGYILTATMLFTMSLVDGTTLVLAGNGFGFADGQGAVARFYAPMAMVVHPVTGVIYIADNNNNRIRKCTAQGLVSTLVGKDIPGNVDGDASTATFNLPYGIVMDPTMVYLYVTCYDGSTLRQVTLATGFTLTVAGNGRWASTDGQGLGASFNGPLYVNLAMVTLIQFAKHIYTFNYNACVE